MRLFLKTVAIAEENPLRPGAVVVIPAGIRHSLQASPDHELEFVIFGTPAPL